MIFEDGIRYDGEFSDGMKSGHGTLYGPKYGRYVGEFRNDDIRGHGTFIFSNGNKYIAEFYEGSLNGNGTIFFSDGTKYVGEFKEGLPNGFGTETTNKGSKYIGEFLKGYKNGQGSHTFPSGMKYVGEFKDGKPNGQGTLKFSSILHVGEFVNAEFNGFGIEYSSSGSEIRRGYWVNDSYMGPKPPSNFKKTETQIQNLKAALNRVSLVQKNGVYTLPVIIHDTISLDFIIDSGAADVSVPADVFGTLVRMGKIMDTDFVGTQKYILADGSSVVSKTFIIRSLKIGNFIVNNVHGSISDVKGSLLLGQSFLKKLNSWTIDNSRAESYQVAS